VELALLHRQYGGPAQIDLRLAHRRGVPWLGGDDDASGTLSDYPTYRYALTTLDASLMQPVPLDGRQGLWNSARNDTGVRAHEVRELRLSRVASTLRVSSSNGSSTQRMSNATRPRR
jgi:hypothetical protein